MVGLSIKRIVLRVDGVSGFEIPSQVNTGFGVFNTTGGFFQSILNIALGVAGIAAVFLVVKGGFELTTSGGNPQKIKEGKEQIVNALTGLLLIAAAVFVIKLIANILGESGISVGQ